jgi:hypothetical protein
VNSSDIELYWPQRWNYESVLLTIHCLLYVRIIAGNCWKIRSMLPYHSSECFVWFRMIFFQRDFLDWELEKVDWGQIMQIWCLPQCFCSHFHILFMFTSPIFWILNQWWVLKVVEEPWYFVTYNVFPSFL